MTTVQITRGASAVVMTREEVATGMVFSIKRTDGRPVRRYAAVGNNGRWYSVDIDTGALSSSENGEKPVVILGKFSFDVDRTFRMGTRIGQQVKRSEVGDNEVFIVKDGAREYAHFGRVNKDRTGYLSVPLDNKDNHAIGKGTSTVTIVGTFKLQAVLSA